MLVPHVRVRLWRLLIALTLAAGTLALPASVSAAPALKFHEQGIALFCDAADETGELHLFAVGSTTGDFAEIFGWAAPVDPDAPPDVSGTAEEVDLVDSGNVATLSVAIPVVDPEGNPLGDAVIEATLTPTGDGFDIEPFRDGNRWIKSTGTVEFMNVEGTLDLPGDLPDFTLAELGCGAERFDVQVFETQPHSFVNDNSGVLVDCFWEEDGTFASVFAVNDEFGAFVDVSLFIEGEHDIFGGTGEPTLNATTISAEIVAFDFLNEVEVDASVSATLEPVGDPVTSEILSQLSVERVTQQRLVPDGTLTFSTGHEFTMDAASCFAIEFDSHFFFNQPSGPRPDGKAPVNDTPDGAITLEIGDTTQAQTGGAALEPEMQVTTCPQDNDAFGRTLWYTFTGTGDPVTIDPAGSNFDSVIAVYDEELTEIACIDDNEFDPIGVTFQGALTVDTVEGATYYIQVGGFWQIFDEIDPQFGRLRLSLD